MNFSKYLHSPYYTGAFLLILIFLSQLFTQNGLIDKAKQSNFIAASQADHVIHDRQTDSMKNRVFLKQTLYISVSSEHKSRANS